MPLESDIGFLVFIFETGPPYTVQTGLKHTLPQPPEEVKLQVCPTIPRIILSSWKRWIVCQETFFQFYFILNCSLFIACLSVFYRRHILFKWVGKISILSFTLGKALTFMDVLLFRSWSVRKEHSHLLIILNEDFAPCLNPCFSNSLPSIAGNRRRHLMSFLTLGSLYIKS